MARRLKLIDCLKKTEAAEDAPQLPREVKRALVQSAENHISEGLSPIGASKKAVNEFLAMTVEDLRKAKEMLKSIEAPVLPSARAFNRPRRIRQLMRKQEEEGLSRFETDELTQLEQSEGQAFMNFFDAERKEEFKLEGEPLSREAAATQLREEVQLALLSGRAMRRRGEGTMEFEFTPPLKRWFGNSKVVDDNGEPLVVFHATGSKEPFEVFERGKVLGGEARFYKATAKKASGGMMFALEGLSPGWFSDSVEQFKTWHRDKPDRLYAAYLKLEKPLILTAGPFEQEAYIKERNEYAALRKKRDDDTQFMSEKEFQRFRKLELKHKMGGTGPDRYEDPFAQLLSMAKIAENDFPDLVPGAALREALKRDGHDGVILRGTTADTSPSSQELHDWYIPFDGGSQIKSATGNRGTFDINDPSILASARARRRAAEGEMEFDFTAAPVEAKAYVEAVKAEGIETPEGFAEAAKVDLGISKPAADDLFAFAESQAVSAEPIEPTVSPESARQTVRELAPSFEKQGFTVEHVGSTRTRPGKDVDINLVDSRGRTLEEQLTALYDIMGTHSGWVVSDAPVEAATGDSWMVGSRNPAGETVDLFVTPPGGKATEPTKPPLLFGEPETIKKKEEEHEIPIRTHRRPKAKPPAETGMDDLFSILVGQREAERPTGVAEWTEGGTIEAPGLADVALHGDAGGGGGRGGGAPVASPDVGGERDIGGDRPGGPEPAIRRGRRKTGRAGKKGEPERVERPVDPYARNYVIERGAELSPRGIISKLRANIEAIRLVKHIESEKRLAMPEEKAALVNYSGWGALSQAFDDDKADRLRRGEIKQRQDTIRRYEKYGDSEWAVNQIADQKAEIQNLENWQEKWGEAHRQIRETLTDEEYRTAARSTINAHYTSPEIISGMWDIAKKLGFRGGNVLEPAAGVGHFFGLMPQEFADKAKLFGVELDSISGRITKLLYPEADVQIRGFQNSDITDNSIDLAISNVPFGNVPVTDKALEVMGGPVSNLHDYFFGKTLTKLRPGGLAIFVTSAFTMDKGNAEIRKWLADRADLVAAFRLPNDAFKANAGTKVVTDVIILRKKDGTPFSGAQDWTSLGDSTTRRGEPIRVNEYYASHPANILGLLDNDGSMFAGEKEMTVHSDPARPAIIALEQAIDSLPADIAGEGAGAEVRAHTAGAVKMGNVVKKDGKFYFQGQEEPDPDLNDPKNHARVVHFIDVRDALNHQYDLELSPDSTDEEIKDNRRKLNENYDYFVARYHDFHHPQNKRLLNDDPDFFRLLGAEVPEKMATGIAAVVAAVKGNLRQKYVKADVFAKRVLVPRREPDTADSLEDAFGISLGWRGRVDTGFIADLLGQSREQVEKSLIEQEIAVRDPETGQILSREQYLAGNVRRKLEIAQAAGPDYERNARMLQTVQPERVDIKDITFKIGATWIPPKVYEEFLRAIGIGNVNVAYHAGDAGSGDFWVVDARKASRYGVEYKDFMTDRMFVTDLLDSLLNYKRITIRSKDAEGNEYIDAAATSAANDAAKRLNSAFVEWARIHETIGPMLENIYNREVNAHAQRTYDGQFLTFPWANKDFDIFPDKKNTVWRAIQEGFGLIAHGVGGGKTIVGAAIALEMRRLGMSKKPMIVVHNATLEQFADTLAKMAPTARVLVGRKDELQGAKRKEFLMRIAAGDWDAVVIAHSTFGLIEDDQEIITRHMRSLVDEVMESLKESGFRTFADAVKASKNNRSVKERIKTIERLEAQILEASKRRTDTGLLNFQQLGVDSLIVDEVHEFKKMPFHTKLDVKGIDSGMSARGYALMMRARTIQERMGGKNVFTMTGTPVTNTLGEIWNMVRLVAPNLLKEYQVEHFDQFVSKFAEVVTESEQGPSGEYKSIERLSKVVNLPEWGTFLRMAADVKLGEDLVVKDRPGIKGGKPQLISLERTKGVTEWVKYIRQVLDGFGDLKGNDFKENPGLVAIPVQAYMASRAAAIDIRLIEPRAKDEPGSKANKLVAEVLDRYRKTKDYSGTQVIFADSYQSVKTTLFDYVTPRSSMEIELDPEKEPGAKFNLYEDMKAKLVAGGIPESEVAIITDPKYDNPKRRLALWDDVNAGKVRVVMGSTQKLGTGVNMQRRMLAAHHLDVPWTPAGLEQRDGRVYRQGNIHGEMGVDIELLRYGMKDTLDAALWQKLEIKQRFILLALSGKISGRELEEINEILNLAEQRAVLSGKYGQEMFEVKNRLRELEASRAGHERTAYTRASEIRMAKLSFKHEQERISKSDTAIAPMQELADKIAKDGVKTEVNNKSFPSKTATMEAIDAAIKESQNAFELVDDESGQFKAPVVTSISVNGVGVLLIPTHAAPRFDEEGKKSYDVQFELAPLGQAETDDISFGRVRSAATLFARLEELGGTIDNLKSSMKANIAKLEKLAGMKPVEAWPYEEEYKAKQARLVELGKLSKGEVLPSGRAAKTAKGQGEFEFKEAEENGNGNGETTNGDGEKTPMERFTNFLPKALSIASRYSNIPGVDESERRQQARLALRDAAKGFDPSRGVAFKTYASTVINNRLKSLYLTEKERSERYGTSLDEEIAEGQTRLETIADTSIEPASKAAALNDAKQILGEVISELPKNLQQVVKGLYYSNKTQPEIARETGLTQQRISQIQDKAFEILREKLVKRGVPNIGAILSRPAGEGEEDPIDSILRALESEGTLDYEAIEELQLVAGFEEPGRRKTGRPDLAFGAANPDVMGADAFYSSKFVPENEEQWRQQADDMLEEDYDGTRKAIEFAGLSGQVLTPAQTKAADIIARDLRSQMLKDGTEASSKAFNVFWYAYRSSGTAAGRALAARRDPVMRPADRYREFLTGMMLKPRPEAQKKIDAAETPAEKAKLIDEETKALLEKLKANGITVEDILQNRVSVRLQNAAIVKEFSKGLNEAQTRAFRMIQQNRPFSDIAKATGLTEDRIRGMKDAFVAKMRAQHFAKFKAGATADLADPGTGLFSAKAKSLWGGPVDDAKAEKEFQKWMAQLGMVENAKQGKPKFSIENPAHVMRMARAIQASRGANVLDMAYEYWIMNILSGPQTQVVNVAGNLLNSAWDMTMQRGMEALVNLAIRDSKSARLGEFRWLAKGIIPGIAKGLAMGAKAWAAEHDFFEHTTLGTPLEIQDFDKGGNIRASIPGKIGRFIRIPGRALLFTDSAFKTAIGQAEVGAHAYRMAKDEGLSGKKLADRIALLSKTREEVISDNIARAKPSEDAARLFAKELAAKDETLVVDDLVDDKASVAWEMAREQAAFDMAVSAGWNELAWGAAVAKAREMTFQQDLKKISEGGNPIEDFASWLQQARASNRLLGLFLPFIRTPFNIFRQGIRKSPLGSLALLSNLARGLYRLKDGHPYLTTHPELVRHLSEQVIAWTAAAIIYAAVQGDADDDDKPVLITGSSPRNLVSQGRKELQQRAYGGDYVIRIGGRNGVTIHYGRYEPFATVLGTMTDAIRAIKSSGATADDLDAFWGYMAEQAKSKTFLQGFAAISNALEGSVNVGDATKRFILTALVPNIIRQPLRNLDDYVRDTKHAQDIYKAFPAGDFAPPRADVYGSDIQKGGTPLTRLFVPAALKADENLQQADKLLINWNRMNPSEAYAPQRPRDTYVRNGKEHKMTDEQYRRFTIAAGRYTSVILRGKLTARQIESPAREDKEIIEKAFADARDTIRKRMLPVGD